MRFKGLFIGLCVVLLTSTLVPHAAADTLAKETQAEQIILGLINQGRTDRSVTPTLTERAILHDLSKQHSADMANKGKNGKLGHFGFCDGWNDKNHTTCDQNDHIVNTRLDEILDSDTGIGFVCENVAYVYGSKYSNTTKAAKKLYKLWVNSPPHYDCMFDQNGDGPSNLGGVGVKKKGAYWWATFEAAHDSTP